jgi:hypothetical protein
MMLAKFFREMGVVVIMVPISRQTHDLAFDFLRQFVAWHPTAIAMRQRNGSLAPVGSQ